MPLFSEKNGYRTKPLLKPDELPVEVRNRLWNALDRTELELENATIFGSSQSRVGQAVNIQNTCTVVNELISKIPFDTIGFTAESQKKHIRDIIFKSEWHTVYDTIEIIIGISKNPILEEHINIVLESEGAGFLWKLNQFVPAITSEEVAEVESALDKASPIQRHLQAAIAILSDKQISDFRNSVKESISAVESACQLATNDNNATLGQALKSIELHPALRESYSKLYGYTSDGDGIRHALTENHKPIDRHTAKYFLITCSAFINYLLAKSN